MKAALWDALRVWQVKMEAQCKGCRMGLDASGGMTGPWHLIPAQGPKYTSHGLVERPQHEVECPHDDETRALLKAIREEPY